MKDLRNPQETGLDSEWQWRSADGDLWLPREMETRHLFFTLRMIWNHSTPEYMHVGQNIRYYRFGSHYTKNYMKTAILCIAPELFRRKDIRPEWQRELDLMASWYREGKFDEVFALEGPRLLIEGARPT